MERMSWDENNKLIIERLGFIPVNDIPNERPKLLDHGPLVEYCKAYLRSLHTILWQGWTLEEDVLRDDGTISIKGTTQAAEWLAKQMEAVFMLIEYKYK